MSKILSQEWFQQIFGETCVDKAAWGNTTVSLPKVHWWDIWRPHSKSSDFKVIVTPFSFSDESNEGALEKLLSETFLVKSYGNQQKFPLIFLPQSGQSNDCIDFGNAYEEIAMGDSRHKHTSDDILNYIPFCFPLYKTAHGGEKFYLEKGSLLTKHNHLALK